MSSWYGSWSPKNARAPGDLHERAFRRKDLADWDAKWHLLTPRARSAFINTSKGPSQNQADHAPTPAYTVLKTRFPADVLEELMAAGFAKVQPARSKSAIDRTFTPAALYDFAARVRMLNRYHLLTSDRPPDLERYVNQVFQSYELITFIRGVLQKAGMNEFAPMGVALNRYVSNHRWPAWVSLVLKDPTADQLVKALQQAGGPVPMADVPGLIPGADPEKVRQVAEKLIGRLVLFEDLDPKTSDIVVDFLPAVREGLDRAGRPRGRPPLVVCDRPAEVGPDDGAIVGDLRAFLLEVAAEPPLLRKDNDLFQKEVDRFRAALEPMPGWLLGLLGWSGALRLEQALAWARTLQLAEDVIEGPQTRLRLTSKGQRWVSSGLDAQYAGVYKFLNADPSRTGNAASYWKLFVNGKNSYYGGIYDDTPFLGDDVIVLKVGKGKRSTPNFYEGKPEDIRVLRAALDRALAALEPGTFYRLDSVAPHLAFGEHNPVNIGLAAEQVDVIRGEQPVPPLEEFREEAGRSLIETFVIRRLIPLGCVRAAIDAEGKVCVARERRLDAYFGREVPGAELAPAAGEAAKVVVQPDFSVIVIGLNPTAAAELAPFCERSSGGGSRGATILKITRDSVVRAVANGLGPQAIVDRLRRHASHEVPANVLHEVRGWSGWVRRVDSATLHVLRCPDRDTADRVMGALKRQAERLNDTIVAIDKRITAAERTKLRAQGIIVEGYGEAPAGGPKPRKKRRGW